MPQPTNEEEECEDVTEDTMSRRWSLEATAGVSQEDEEEEELMQSGDGESVDSETFVTETESGRLLFSYLTHIMTYTLMVEGMVPIDFHSRQNKYYGSQLVLSTAYHHLWLLHKIY